MTFRDVRSGAQLPSLSQLRAMPLSERESALEGWVVWLDAHRHLVSDKFESLLDQALRELREDSVGSQPAIELDGRFAEWLDSAGQVGKGHGPDEDGEDV